MKIKVKLRHASMLVSELELLVAINRKRIENAAVIGIRNRDVKKLQSRITLQSEVLGIIRTGVDNERRIRIAKEFKRKNRKGLNHG